VRGRAPFVGLCLSLGCFSAVAGAQGPAARVEDQGPRSRPAPRELRIGTVGTSPGEGIERFLPIRNYLAARLAPADVAAVRIVVAKDLCEMAAWMREGKADLLFDSPFPSLLVRRLAGARFILRRWKRGIAEYRPVLFARKDAGLRVPEDLRGRTIAFEEPFSSTGYFFPKALLRERGLRPILRKEGAPPLGPEEVGYLFSASDENTVVWVLRGKVDAGATDSESLPRRAKGEIGNLVVLCEGPAFPRQIVSARGDLPAGLLEEVRSTLLGMEESEPGRKALDAFEKTARFDAIPEASLASLQAFEAFLEEELPPP
jgi:phosphonate transport system substrate-binding protein